MSAAIYVWTDLSIFERLGIQQNLVECKDDCGTNTEPWPHTHYDSTGTHA